MSFKSVQSYPNRLLVLYERQLEQHEHQLQNIRQVLPSSLAKHALHCLVSHGKLILYTDSPAWASQLRFYKKDILAAVASIHGISANELQIRILTGTTGHNVSQHSIANRPSKEYIEQIRNQSQHISDNDLKRALQKLCSTLSSNASR